MPLLDIVAKSDWPNQDYPNQLRRLKGELDVHSWDEHDRALFHRTRADALGIEGAIAELAKHPYSRPNDRRWAAIHSDLLKLERQVSRIVAGCPLNSR